VADLVQLEVADGVGTIRLDRPPMNALSRQMQEELRAAALEAGARQDVSAVVVYGGPKVFAAGADVKEMSGWGFAEIAAVGTSLQSSLTTLAELPKPTVAAVTGYALGGGLELALCCDFRVVGDNVRLGQPEIQLGVMPGAGGTQRLPRLVGPARAKDMIFTGRFVGAEEALAIGLVDAVVPPDDVYEAATESVRRYVGGPALALAAAKEAVDRGLSLDLDSGLALERRLFASLFATQDKATGMTSFVENGPGQATFVGR
jgi:enoyl-CoA hydratase/carnithine racemase